MRPAFDSTSEFPLPLNPKKKFLEGARKKAPGAVPKTPSLPKDTATARQKDKKKAPSEVSTKKLSSRISRKDLCRIFHLRKREKSQVRAGSPYKRLQPRRHKKETNGDCGLKHSFLHFARDWFYPRFRGHYTSTFIGHPSGLASRRRSRGSRGGL